MNKFVLFAVLVGLAACTAPPEGEKPETEKYITDTHSFARPNEVAITHLDLSFDVRFEERRLDGVVTYTLERNGGNLLVVDMQGLEVHAVHLGENMEGAEANFRFVKGNDLGDALEIDLTDSIQFVTVSYATSPDAAALLWLEAAQTHDKRMPFLFTQGQAILTRSWIPLQDSPAIRITYNAKVRVPEGMLAVMSAENPTGKNANSEYHFRMDLPIPPYLMALAVGDITFQSLGDRTGVYAEPGLLAKAVYEFDDMEKMLQAAEALYGPYAWGRYDVLVLPPSFPFGGMENPKLTFATPTIIAGDRSLTSLIAHELAHSWSGNLVTNASWNDFWLNEGFTVYFERRIMEAIYGREYAEMLNVLGYQDLMVTLDELGPESADTHLKLDLDGRNPDDGMNDIAYEKGYLLLRALEERVGRETFDRFLSTYFNRHAYGTMTTEAFVAYLDSHLLQGISPRPDVEAWIYRPGLPEGHPVPVSPVFDNIDSLKMQWMKGSLSLTAFPVSAWTTHEWLHFLRGIPQDAGIQRLAELDKAFNLTLSGNAEIAAAWYLLAIHNDYRPAFGAMEAFLVRVGRRKFVKPLYEALSQKEEHLTWARRVYTAAKPNYHAVTTATVEGILYPSAATL